MPPKILAFAGSTRSLSYNKMLAENAAEIAREQGARVNLIDLRDYPLPLYDGDLEESHGIPENGLEIRRMMCDSHGFLVISPEYNSSISAVLKNTIDWVSRPRPDEPPLVAFKGKTAALLATSPGWAGGMRGLVTVRYILGNIGMHVIPEQLALGKAGQLFGNNRELIDESARQGVSRVVKQLIEITEKLNSPAS